MRDKPRATRAIRLQFQFLKITRILVRKNKTPSERALFGVCGQYVLVYIGTFAYIIEYILSIV